LTILDKDEALLELSRLREGILPEGGCLLCALVNGGASPPPLAESERAVVLLDRFARREGHLLIVSKAHVEGVLEIDWETHQEVQRLLFEARRALYRALSPVQVYSATFGATTQVPMSFAHYHAHVIPIYERDERARPARVLSWSEGVVVYTDGEASSLRQRILDHWLPATTSETLS
jgi:histidine triad (HIT) family protein